MQSERLSLSAAILININVMLGTGIFINTVELSKRAGFWGSFLYLGMGLLILPLIISIAALMKLHPTQGFYGFGKAEISPFAGFISAWSYFTGKLASAMLMIHVAALLLQQVIPGLTTCSVYSLDIIVLSIFILLNMLNIRIGSYIQMGFLGLKCIPIIWVLLTGVWFFTGVPTVTLPLQVLASFPLALYVMLGFEATCSLSSRIQDPERNGPKAIFYSCAIAVSLVFLFQFLLYALIGEQLIGLTNYLQTFPTLLMTFFGVTSWTPYAIGLLHSAIACSALGGSYGILYSNSWNLYTVAQHGHVIGSRFFTYVTKAGIPLYCLLVEGVFCLLFLWVTHGSQVPLQQVSALSSVVAYTVSVFALLCAVWHKKARSIPLMLPILGLFSCSILCAATIKSFFLTSLFSLGIFTGLMIIGILFFTYYQYRGKIS